MSFPAHTPACFLVEWGTHNGNRTGTEGVHQLWQDGSSLPAHLGPVVFATADEAEARVTQLRALPEAARVEFRVVEYRRHAAWVPS